MVCGGVVFVESGGGAESVEDAELRKYEKAAMWAAELLM